MIDKKINYGTSAGVDDNSYNLLHSYNAFGYNFLWYNFLGYNFNSYNSKNKKLTIKSLFKLLHGFNGEKVLSISAFMRSFLAKLGRLSWKLKASTQGCLTLRQVISRQCYIGGFFEAGDSTQFVTQIVQEDVIICLLNMLRNDNSTYVEVGIRHFILKLNHVERQIHIIDPNTKVKGACTVQFGEQIVVLVATQDLHHCMTVRKDQCILNKNSFELFYGSHRTFGQCSKGSDKYCVSLGRRDLFTLKINLLIYDDGG